MNEVIIDKDTDISYIINNFPIHWSMERVSGLIYCIDRCKQTGVVFKLVLDKDTVYRLEVIKGEQE